MKIFKIQLADNKLKGLHPQEDSAEYTNESENGIFAVADGITRDPIGIGDFTGRKLEEVLKGYPNPSPAKFAADTFTKSFIKYFESNTDRTIRDAFIHCNQKIKELNDAQNPNHDYLENDFWACVACGGIIKNKILYWGNVDDCAIKVFNKDFNLTFASPNQHLIFEEYFHTNKNHPTDFDWNKPKSRMLVRKEYRNNPNQKDSNGNIVSYGALTGEKSTEDFINTGELKLENGDFVIFYSDGFEDLLQDLTLRNILYQVKEQNDVLALENHSNGLANKDHIKFGRERSMILVLV